MSRIESSNPPGVLISISSALRSVAVRSVEGPSHFIGAHRLNRVIQHQLVHNRLLSKHSASS